MSANDKQISGNHYKQFKGMEPWDVITYWGLGYLDGTALKYIARWKHKGGIADLEKAIHFLEKAVEVERSALDVVSFGRMEFMANPSTLPGAGSGGDDVQHNTTVVYGFADDGSADIHNELNNTAILRPDTYV